jgi:4,5-DOPA dioxygenase extradiol
MREINNINPESGSSSQMPVFFLGHGSPMNAIEENEFTESFRNIGKEIPRPGAIVCISAHWETRGTRVTAMEHPRTIHDFGGFPRKLYEVQYPAPGNPELAREITGSILNGEIKADYEWGLDHGTWSVMKHLYPDAEIPVIQISLDYNKTPQQHYELAKELSWLRKKGVLVIGSGNMVHNLRLVAWDKLNNPEYGYDWAYEAVTKMKQFILGGDNTSLINYRDQGKAFDLAIPSPDHFLPLLYVLALRVNDEKITFFNDKVVGGSLAMASLKIANP